MFFFMIAIKLDRVSFETKGRQNLQKTADFVIESIALSSIIYIWRSGSYTFVSQRSVVKNMAADELSMT